VLPPITDGHDSTVISVTVFHGQRPGLVLGIIAGAHGYAYPPIVAAQQFLQTLDTAQWYRAAGAPSQRAHLPEPPHPG